MFYSSYGNIKLDNTQCSSSNDLDIPKIEVAKEKALKLINIFSDKNNLEDVNKKILIKLINQDIDSYYDIYDKSDKKYYNQNLISEKIKEQSLKIEINRLLNLIINKSNFYITPQIKSKNSNIIPQKEGGIDVELKSRNVTNEKIKVPYKTLYNNSTIQIIADWHKDDIDTWGFDFDTSATKNFYFEERK